MSSFTCDDHSPDEYRVYEYQFRCWAGGRQPIPAFSRLDRNQQQAFIRGARLDLEDMHREETLRREFWDSHSSHFSTSDGQAESREGQFPVQTDSEVSFYDCAPTAVLDIITDYSVSMEEWDAFMSGMDERAWELADSTEGTGPLEVWVEHWQNAMVDCEMAKALQQYMIAYGWSLFGFLSPEAEHHVKISCVEFVINCNRDETFELFQTVPLVETFDSITRPNDIWVMGGFEYGYEQILDEVLLQWDNGMDILECSCWPVRQRYTDALYDYARDVLESMERTMFPA